MIVGAWFGLAALALAGCGRIDFDPHDDARITRDAADDDAAPDANPACLVDDGVCVYGCVGIDTDCDTTCGDGICIGNAGEMCVNCQADCRTLNPVCGNGACDPGEAAAGCVADCGPMPWQWSAEEADLLAKVNAVRTAGHTCPNGVRPPVAAFTVGAFLADAREWTWELAHQKFFMMGGTVCNGRTFPARSQNFTLYASAALVSGPSYPNVDATLAKWLGNANECDGVMSAVSISASIGVAHDDTNAYVMLMTE